MPEDPWRITPVLWMHTDSEDAALVTSHLHHPHPPHRHLCAQRGAARRSAAQVSAAPSSCHRPHWLTEQQHVGAYLTDQPPSPPRRTEEPAIGGTADARWRSAAWAAPTRRDRPEERVSAIITGSRSIMRFEIAFQRVQGNVVFFQLRAGGGRRCRCSSQSALPGGDRCCS